MKMYNVDAIKNDSDLCHFPAGGDIRPKGLASFVLGLAYEKNRESEEAIKVGLNRYRSYIASNTP